jgi:hypothetical protein
MNDDDKITRFPIKSWQRWKNRLGRRCAACIVSDRWLEFSEKSASLAEGDVIWINVMTRPDGEKVRKLCELAVTKQDLQRALDAVDK